MFPSRMPGHSPDNADGTSRRRAMQSALHPRSKATGLRLLRRLQRRRRKPTSPTSKTPAVRTLVVMSAVMAVLFALLTLFLWRQGVTSFVIYRTLGLICQAPFSALRPLKEGSRSGIEFTLRA